MSDVYIYGEYDDIVTVRVADSTHKYRIKIGNTWLCLPPTAAERLHAKLGVVLYPGKDGGQP